MQGRLLRTRAHAEDRRIQPLHHSTGRHRLPELPRRHQAPQRAIPEEERPDTIHLHNEMCRRQPDPNMRRHPARITTAGKETRQMLYVSHVANKLYLSLSSCKDLGLVQGSFPGNQVTATIRNNPTMTHQAGPPPASRPPK